jgi:hypothetical protein
MTFATDTTRSDREYNKFVADSTGATAIRAVLTDADIQIGAVEIKDHDSSARLDILTQDSAFGTTATGLGVFGKYQATPTTYTDGDAAPILLDANGRIVLSSDIEIGAVELKDGTSDARAVISGTDGVLVNHGTNNDVTVTVPTTLSGGEKTVSTSGTAEALGTTLVIKSLYIRAKAANTGYVYVGDSNVDKTTSQQLVLSAGESVSMDISNRSTVYIDVSVNGEGVDYLAFS